MENFIDLDPVFVRGVVEHELVVKGSYSYNAPSDLDYYGYSEYEVGDIEVFNSDTKKINDPDDVLAAIDNSCVEWTGKGKGVSFEDYFEIKGYEKEDGYFVCTSLNVGKALDALKEKIESEGPPEREPDFDVPDYD